MHVFISYNQADSEIATALATQLRLVGADVWLDAWEIRPGDSIPGKVAEALAYVDTVVVVWSGAAAASNWVGAELEAALARRLAGEGLRVTPLVLDDTLLPALLRPLKWIALAEPAEVDRAAREIAGLNSQADFLRAVQETLEVSGLEVGYVEGDGAAVGCPECGAGLAELEGWSQVDERRDDTYAGARCTRCGWTGGGEIW